MRDLLIGVGYFLTTAWVAFYGFCLLLKPQRFSAFLSRPLFTRRSMEQVQDWTERDSRYWRKMGFIMVVSGMFMFLMPLVIAVRHPDGVVIPSTIPQPHHSIASGWLSYAVWLLILCLGTLLVANPLSVLGYFRPEKRSIASNSSDGSLGPRMVGGVVILIALLGLFEVASH
jgi:hypothetical protein